MGNETPLGSSFWFSKLDYDYFYCYVGSFARSTEQVPRRCELPSSVQESDWYRWNRADPGRAMVPGVRDRVV